MKLSSLVLAVATGIAVLMLALFSLPEPQQSHGATHPEFSSMEHGGAGIDRSGYVLLLGWGFGVLEIVLFVAMIALGANTRRGLRGLGPLLVIAGICFASVWTALVFSYRAYATGTETVLFLGFPAPTAWVLFAIWPVPALFVALYSLGFDRWVATPRDLAELENRLAQLRIDSDVEAEHGED